MLVYLFQNLMYFCCMFSLKTKIQKILSMLGTGYFLKIAKINSQQEKPQKPNRKKQFLQNAKNRQSAQINSRKNFVPRGMLDYVNIFLHNSYFILGLRIIIGNPKKVFNLFVVQHYKSMKAHRRRYRAWTACTLYDGGIKPNRSYFQSFVFPRGAKNHRKDSSALQTS